MGIYPYNYLNDNYSPDLRNKNDIVSYLSVNGIDKEYVSQLLSTKKQDGSDKTDEEKKSDKAIVKKLVVRIAVKNQLYDADMRRKGRSVYNDFYKNSNEK